MASAKIELYLLGTPELRRAGQPVNFETRKAMALLAYLAVTAHSQSRDTLAALLWGEFDQSNARASLRRTLSTLNKGLEGTGLAIERETLSLEPGPDFWADVTEFNQSLKAVKAQLTQSKKIDAASASRLETTVALWRGEFMQGFSLRDSPEFEEWQSQVAENFQREMVWSLEMLTNWYAASHAFATAIDYARHWLTLDPLNETTYCQLMQFYAWNGQPSLALKEYQECVQILEWELGVAPLETTTALYEAIKERSLEPPPPLVSPELAQVLVTNPGTPIVKSAQNTGFALVGRKAQWQALETGLQMVAQRQQGSLIAIEGEPGIGKTRLVEDFLEQQTQGWKVIKVSCYEGEAEMAYGVVSAILRTALVGSAEKRQLEAIEAEWRNEAARLLPELGAGSVSVPSLDSPGAQSRFYEGLRQTLADLGGSPVLLFLDDLQWIDAASLDFLIYLAHRIQEQPLYLVMAWRSGTLTTQSKLAQLLTTAKRQDYATTINLNRLNRSEVAELVNENLPERQAGLIPALYAETEGLPFFVIEYIEAYRRGLFQAEDFGKAGGLILPGGVRDLLEARLRSLGETAWQLLQTAAVLGQGFDFDTLREVSGRSETETIGGLEELTAASIVSELEQTPLDLRYDFSHEKFRTLAYEKTSPARRRLLHRRVAETYVSRKVNQEPLYGQIGYHYRQAGNEPAAAGFYKLAADYARSLYANREALNYYQIVLALDPTEAGSLYEAIGDMYTLLGEYIAALQHYHLALPHSKNTARLEYKAGKIYLWQEEWELGVGQFETAHEQVGDDFGLSAQINTDWGLALHHLKRDDEARLLLKKALAHAIQGSNKPALAQAHNIMGLLAVHRHETEVATTHLKESLSLAVALNDQTLRAATLNNMARVKQAIGEFAKAIELTETALQIVSSQGDRHRQAALLSNLGDLYQALGQTEKAQFFVKESVSIYAEIGVEAGTFQPGIWMLTDW